MALSKGQKKQRRKLASMGRAPGLRGDKSKAQRMAISRIGTGTPRNPNRSISSIQSSQQKSIRQAAADRHSKFKQTGVQTFGGTRSDDSYSKPERTKIQDAGYKVEGFSKAPFTNVKPEEPKTKFNKADSNLLAGDYTSSYTQKNWGLRPDGVHGPYKVGDVFGPGGVSNPLFRFTGTGWERVKAQADTTDTSDTSGMVASTNLSGLGMTPKVSDYDPGSTAFAIKTGNYDPAAYEAFKKSGLNLSDLDQSDKKGGLTSRTIENRGLGFLDAITGNKYDFDNLGGQTIEGQIQGANRKHLKNIFGNSYNIAENLGITDSIKNNLPWNKEQPKFATWRVNANENKAIQPIKAPSLKDIRSDISSAFGVDNSLAGFLDAASGRGTGDYQNIANIVSDIKDITSASGIKNKAQVFQNLSTEAKNRLINAGGNVVDNSKVFQNLGEQYTGSKTFKPQTQNLLSAINQTMKEASKDTSGRVDPINKMLKSFNDIEGYGTLSRFLESKGDKNKNLSTRANIINAYDTSSPTLKTLSHADRGLVGSIGNLLIGGKMSDIFRANNPYTEEGRGTEFTNVDSANLIANTLVEANTPGSITNKRVNQIRRLVTPGVDVTPGSLIRGTLPFNLPTIRGGGGNNISPQRTNTRGQLRSGNENLPIELPLIPEGGPVSSLPNQVSNPQQLAGIQNQSYQNTLNQLLGFTPNFAASFAPMGGYRVPQRQSFKTAFNRDYFPISQIA